MSGVRSVKIAEGLKHEYVTQNGRVVRDYVTDASTGAFVRCLDFFYDEAGRPFAMRSYYDSTITGYDTFHYVLNAQGDVVQLNYQGGAVYAQYTYDAWGNVLTKSGSYADLNPLRYRGYYYDTETGFYYLQSRYYDPIVKRFINADSYGSTGTGLLGFNMFAYCENNPAVCIDSDGHACLMVGINSPMTDSGDHGGGGSGGAGLGTAALVWLLDKIAGFLSSSAVPDVIIPCEIIPKANVKAVPHIKTKSIAISDEKADEKNDYQSETTIYRYYTTKTDNLAPRPGEDFDGLSFSLNPPTRSKQYPVVVTTIEAVEATGILTTVQKGTHVSIVPTNGTVAEWMDQGQNSCWSFTLSLIVIQLGG